MLDYGLWFFASFILAVLLTPVVKLLAIKMKAVDYPDYRKVHEKLMPRMGGLAIALAYTLPLIYIFAMKVFAFDRPFFSDHQLVAYLIGGWIIVLLGIVDDIYQISAKYKFLGQLIAAIMVVAVGIKIDYITLPGDLVLSFGVLSLPITLIWLVGVTNALNLIDGLDGLAAGVAAIALATIAIIGFSMGNIVIAFMVLLLLGSTLGFLIYNFYPAKIFMGDTGSLFLGYNLAVFSLLGFKHVALVSFLIPIVILAVPIADTFFAIVRRMMSKKPITKPDKNHLHHCLLRMGFSHRKTVLVIYAISVLFSVLAIIFSRATSWWAFVVLGVTLVAVAVGADVINILDRRGRDQDQPS